MKFAIDPRRLTVAIGLVLAAALASAPILAQHPRHGHEAMGARTHMQRMLRHLDLTDAQRGEVRGLVKRHHETMEGRIDQLQDARVTLFDRVHDSELDGPDGL